jgi:hypothetical protein
VRTAIEVLTWIICVGVGLYILVGALGMSLVLLAMWKGRGK